MMDRLNERSPFGQGGCFDDMPKMIKLEESKTDHPNKQGKKTTVRGSM